MLDQQSVGRLSRMDAMQRQSMDLAREERRKAQSQCWRRRCVVLMRMSLAIVLPVVSMSLQRLEIDPAVTLCVDCQR